jgi:hypothetical protein
VPRLGQHEPGLPPLAAEPPAEPAVWSVWSVWSGAAARPVRRCTAHLGPQCRYVIAGPGGLRPAEQPEGYFRRRHGSGPIG